MRLCDVDRRVAALERNSGAGTAVLSFPDGSVRALRLGNPVAVLIEAWSLEYARLAGMPDPTDLQYRRQIDLLGAADSVSSTDNLILLIHQQAKQLKQESESYASKTL